jgi:hypothetical protein
MVTTCRSLENVSRLIENKFRSGIIITLEHREADPT